MIEKEVLAHEVIDDVRNCTIDDALEDGQLSFYLPIQWEDSDGIGGKGVKDPLTIYSSWDVNGCDERVTFKTTLKDLLEDTYELHMSVDDGSLDERSTKIMESIRDGLLKEVKRVEKWISMKEKK